MRRAKIVATLGPASSDPEVLQRLLAAGVDVARLNFSHGRHEDHAKMIDRIGRAARHLGARSPFCRILQGPKIRTGKLAPAGRASGSSGRGDRDHYRERVTGDPLAHLHHLPAPRART